VVVGCSRLRHFLELSVLVMIPIVGGRPRSSADIAELMLASTGHVIAPLVFLDHEPAFLTLPIVQVVLKKQDLLLIAFPHVGCEQALPTKLLPAAVADHHVVHSRSDDALTVFLGTQLSFGVTGCLLELLYLFVLFLDVGRQVPEEGRVDVEQHWAVLLRAVDLFEVADLVDDVVMEA
jgi:hypothetical protein